jgi:hypothetical protein
MNDQDTKLEHARKPDGFRGRCRSCGGALTHSRRRYCSDGCEQQLRHELWIAEGLLRALGAQFATFRWTDHHLILQVLPFGADNGYCFFFNRTASMNPASDFKRMVQKLGTAWSGIRDATRSPGKATNKLLEGADSKFHPGAIAALTTGQLVLFGVADKDLQALQLTKEDLRADDWEARMTRAFRRQAQGAHPDHGGTEEKFIRIKSAFETLSAWRTNPDVSSEIQTSLPDAWVYHGARISRRWSPPSS